MFNARETLTLTDKTFLVLQMLTLILTLTTYTTLFTIFTSATPLVLGLIVLILALNIALSTALSSFSWFGFVIFLIYIGGILVIFAYFAALTPNSSPALTPTIVTFFITFFLLLLHFYSDVPTLSITPLTALSPRPSFLTLFSPRNLIPLLLLAFILFLALVAVVKISNHSAGPLRPFA